MIDPLRRAKENVTDDCNCIDLDKTLSFSKCLFHLSSTKKIQILKTSSDLAVTVWVYKSSDNSVNWESS